MKTHRTAPALLLGTLPDDVARVLRANRDASYYNHLPAFQRCQ